MSDSNVPADRGALSPTVDAFVEHLRQETLLLEETRDTLEMVQSAMLNRSRPELEESVHRQVGLAERIAESAARRQSLRALLGQLLGRPAEAITLSQLIQVANSSQSERLKDFAPRLGSLARRIDQLTCQNATLARQQMDLFQRLLDCLTGTESAAPRYQSNGDAESTLRRSVFEMRC